MENARKEKEGKLLYELDFLFIKQMAERMADNKDKYPPYNWMNLDNVDDLKQAMYRHVNEIMLGNYQDGIRAYGHLEALAINAMFITYQLRKKPKQKGILAKMMEEDEKDGLYNDVQCGCDPANPKEWKPIPRQESWGDLLPKD